MKHTCDQVRSVIITSFTVMCVLLSAGAASAQNWRGFEPIKSTCRDVERLLGGDVCGKQNIEYKLPDATVSFVFANRPCDEKWPYEQYNVPPGTVTWILAIPRYPTRLFIPDLKMDMSKFQKGDPGDMLGAVVYLSREMGIEFTASEEEGQVTDVTYSPAAKYDHLRCSHLASAQPANEQTIYGLSPLLVGEYHPPSPDKEKLLFNKLVSELNEISKHMPEAEAQKATVYVITYAGRRARAREAQKWAERAKRCLVSEYKINASRIISVDGGYRENTVVQLFIRPFGASAPRIEPTVHPNKVELIESKKKMLGSSPFRRARH